MLEALATLLVFQTIGEVLSYGWGCRCPARCSAWFSCSACCCYGPQQPPGYARLRLELLKHLSLLFVLRASASCCTPRASARSGLPIVVALIASTALAIAVTALVVTWTPAGWVQRRRGMTPSLDSIWVYLAATPLLGLTATLLAYLVAWRIYQRTGMNRSPTGRHRRGAAGGATRVDGNSLPHLLRRRAVVHFLLGPATVALAIPLYDQRARWCASGCR